MNSNAVLLEEKERKRQGYIRAMERKYGLKQDYYLHSSTISDPIAKKGDFWCFKVEMSPDDGTLAMVEVTCICILYELYKLYVT